MNIENSVAPQKQTDSLPQIMQMKLLFDDVDDEDDIVKDAVKHEVTMTITFPFTMEKRKGTWENKIKSNTKRVWQVAKGMRYGNRTPTLEGHIQVTAKG